MRLTPGGVYETEEFVEDRIAREARHQLVTQPYYTVFDNLAYQVNGYTVTLLPLSPMDNRIRRAVYHSHHREKRPRYFYRAVGNQGDKERAGITAKGVRGVFSVTNDLLVSP